MKLKIPVFIWLLVINNFLLTASGLPERDKEETLRMYKKCLLNRDAQLIDKVIDDSFRIGVYQQPFAAGMFASFLEMMQAPDSLFWDEVQISDGKTYCMVHYVLGDKTISSTVTFSDKGYLLFSDWLDEKGFRMQRRKPSKKVTSIPFKLDNGRILLKASLNNTGKELRMIFDTGADGMALRTDLQDSCKVKVTRSQTANVPGGQMQTRLSAGNRLMFDSLIINNQNLVLFDRMVSPNVDGIVGGSNLFRNYIVEVDFENQLLHLYTHGQFKPIEGYRSNRMTYAGGVPTVPFYIYRDGRLFESEFIFDTGAVYEAILFGAGSKLLEQDSIFQYIPSKYFSYNYSVGHRSRIVIGKADSIRLAGVSFENVNLAMEPYNEDNHSGHNVLGSIGIKTLSRFNWIVDLTNYQIYSRPNHFSNLPMAFELNGYLVEYTGQRLKVIGPVNRQADVENSPIKAGDYILKLNEIPSLQLTVNKLESILQSTQISIELSRNNEIITSTLILN